MQTMKTQKATSPQQLLHQAATRFSILFTVHLAPASR